MVIPLIWRSPNLILIILGGMAIKYFLVIMTHHYDIISGMFKSFGVTVSQSEWVCVQVRIDSDLSARHSRRRPGPDRLAVFYQLVSLSIFGLVRLTRTSLSQFVSLSLYRLFFEHGLDQNSFRRLIFYLPLSFSLSPEWGHKQAETRIFSLVILKWSRSGGAEPIGTLFFANFQVWFTSNRTLLFFLSLSQLRVSVGPLFPVYQFGGGESVSPQLSILFFQPSLTPYTHTAHASTAHTSKIPLREALPPSPTEKPSF